MDAKIVNVDLEPAFSNHVGENTIHKRLEGERTITEPEEHYSGFEETKRHDEGAFPLVLFLDSDIVVSPTYIKLGE
jgi:hypothetical protein